MNKQSVNRFNLPFAFPDVHWTRDWAEDGWMADGRKDEVEETVRTNEEDASFEVSSATNTAVRDVKDRGGPTLKQGFEPLVGTVELETKVKKGEED